MDFMRFAFYLTGTLCFCAVIAFAAYVVNDIAKGPNDYPHES